MMHRKLVLVLALGLVYGSSNGQRKDIYRTIDKYSDSIVLSHLVNYFPNDSILKKEIILDGKIQRIRKYYNYKSFNLPMENKSKCLRIINFGALIEHSPNFMLVMKMSDNVAVEQFVLGKESLEKDLITLQKLFSSLSNEVKEKYKLEILDIFFQSRRGIMETSCYLH